jgi:ankyrin repeat protein
VNLDEELIDAAVTGNLNAAERCLNIGAYVNFTGADGYMPLHWAARNGHADTVTLLLDRGADLTAKDKLGHTPLHRAAHNGRTDIAANLLGRGADPCVKANDSVTPLDMILRGTQEEREGFDDLADRLKSKYPEAVVDWWMKEGSN